MAEATLEPPSYDGYGFQAMVASSHGAPSDLPAYTRRPTPPPIVHVDRKPQLFTYHIKNRSGVSWATLTVQGDPRLTKLAPTIVEGSSIVGSVELALQSAEAIQAVSVLVKGELRPIAPAAVPVLFLELKHVLWSAAEGDPRSPGTSSKISGGKLKGDYNWPFSIALPTSVCKDGKTFQLPHTFLDRIAGFSMRYTAELRIIRGKLRPDDKVLCIFAYFSMRQPGPPSALRRVHIFTASAQFSPSHSFQLAYQENSPLLGPEADPEGWHTEALPVQGTIFSSRMINAKCKFSLATPLSFTRSTSIPCAMTIESNDKQALDLLSSPTACIVYLERVIQDNAEGYRSPIEPCGQAVFWPSTEGDPAESSSRRHLMGEIHLRANLQPSSAMLGFAIEYAVVVFPFQAAGYKPLDTQKPLSRQVVEIVTRYAPGPRQKTYSPPAYEGRNTAVDQYYYHLVIQRANGNGGTRARAGRRG
ncbi:hypothetical protein GGX14DRAFT_519162 [Mycena pura]|uniref:Arrestin-like N-terminal domain-containing protein n=1 Tax=Mycena pura TaxID=153505 RepID=A0AAD6VHD1_9AGAR|nr:hypothetical protein GGX14DRAFT_519162 [Mycena pura]